MGFWGMLSSQPYRITHLTLTNFLSCFKSMFTSNPMSRTHRTFAPTCQVITRRCLSFQSVNKRHFRKTQLFFRLRSIDKFNNERICPILTKSFVNQESRSLLFRTILMLGPTYRERTRGFPNITFAVHGICYLIENHVSTQTPTNCCPSTNSLDINRYPKPRGRPLLHPS